MVTVCTHHLAAVCAVSHGPMRGSTLEQDVASSEQICGHACAVMQDVHIKFVVQQRHCIPATPLVDG